MGKQIGTKETFRLCRTNECNFVFSRRSSLGKGAPSTRRRFMDLEFGQINSEYLYFLSQYRQVLQQRNNYLKQLSIKKANDLVFLDVLSDQLAGIAAEIISRRIKYIKNLIHMLKVLIVRLVVKLKNYRFFIVHQLRKLPQMMM